jgi:hypothetical protein
MTRLLGAYRSFRVRLVIGSVQFVFPQAGCAHGRTCELAVTSNHALFAVVRAPSFKPTFIDARCSSRMVRRTVHTWACVVLVCAYSCPYAALHICMNREPLITFHLPPPPPLFLLFRGCLGMWWRTALRAGRSRVRFPVELLEVTKSFRSHYGPGVESAS